MSAALAPEIKQHLVAKAERIVEKVRTKRGQTSQLRNLIQVTQTESEVPVLRNFIRYQAGRKATKTFWSAIHQDVIEVLQEIEKDRRLGSPEMRRLAIQHFFGYMVRHYVYVTEVKRDRPPGKHQAAGGGKG